MRRLFTSFLVLFSICLALPMTAFAVKFSITETSIDAYLQSDGTVEVHETHTYSFDGVFNGITRELIPKKGASIAQFAAYENGQALQTEREGHLYRVYRGGDSEAITVDLYYTIENGMAFYPDVGEFYWPFFDRRNKSDYERLTITIHPPEPTAAEVIAFGADEAFATETILKDGTVVFQLGYVPAGRNGDIRVAYDAGLFSAATLTSDQPMRDTILQAQQDGIERVIKSVHRQHRVEQIANYVLSMVTVILIVLVVRALVEVGHKRNVILRNLEGADRSAVPELVMSLPATLHVIHPNINLAHTLTSALLDLARQGYVERSSEQSFRQIHRESPHLHERILLKWLFDEMSGGEEFHFDDMETYVKKRENHQNYLSFKYNWRKAIKEEMKQHKVYKKSWPIRLFAAALFLVLAIFLIVMIVSQVSAWYYVWIVTLLEGFLLFPILYRPKSTEGLQIQLEWKQFMERYRTLSRQEWNKWSEEERTRAFLITNAMNRRELTKKNEELIPELKRTSNKMIFAPTSSADDSADVVMYAVIAGMIATGFQMAERETSPSGDGSGGYSGGAGGAGGGGGGSGAF